jgi:uncharacterized membrane protein
MRLNADDRRRRSDVQTVVVGRNASTVERVDCGITVMMILNAIVLLILGIRIDYRQIRSAGLALITFSMLKLYFHDLQELENIYRVVALILMGILLIGGSTLYLRIRKSPEPSESPDDGDLSNPS